MNTETQRRLLEINHAFYDRFARQFADSRSTGQASVRRVLAMVANGERILDVGCGDGRVARALDEIGLSVSYTGLDASAGFVSLAQERAAHLAQVKAGFVCADVTQPDWLSVLPQTPFDTVLGLAVLHHIPGQEARQRIVQQMASLVTPAGRLIASTWQFLSGERLRKKIVSWAMVGLDDSQVDPGDYLLNWERGGYGLRYCHLVGEDDLRGLCEGAGLQVSALFLEDNGLNLYVVAKRQSKPLAKGLVDVL